MFSLLYPPPPLCPSKCFTNQWGARSAGCQISRRRAEGVIERWIVCAFAGADAVQAGRVCYLQQLNVSGGLSFCFIPDRPQMSAGRRKKKKAALLDVGHAAVKDDYILLGLPAVIASHFSSTQRQGGEWLRTPITLMSPRPAMRSS